jgi:hypothetical protein
MRAPVTYGRLTGVDRLAGHRQNTFGINIYCTIADAGKSPSGYKPNRDDACARETTDLRYYPQYAGGGES